MKIMVVEDTEDSRILLEDVLRTNSYEVDSATNGIEALKKLKQSIPSLIISDILMPEMDGFEFCQQVKHDPQLRAIPFIFYSATYTDNSDKEFAMSLGASLFVIKPKDPIEFIEIIKGVLAENTSHPSIQPDPVKMDDAFKENYARILNKKLFSKIITLERQEEELKLASLVLDNSSEGMMVSDTKNNIIMINPAFTEITGYEFEEIRGKNPRVLSAGYHDLPFYQAMWHELLSAGKWHGEIWGKRKNGETYPKWLTINTICNKNGSIHRYVALFSDISDKKQSEELIWRQANFDSLTELPNRDMFRNILEREIKKSKRDKLSLALLLLDIDLFKEVNDTLGLDVGDALLKETAGRIGDCIREIDTVARMGGDEFSVIITGLCDTSHVDNIAHKIAESLSKPYQLGDEVVYVSASTGITLYPNDAEDMATLMKNADQAMYAAKQKGRNRFNYFTQSLQDAAQYRLRMTNDLRVALESNQLRINFQPIVHCKSGRIYKAEALIRWQHPLRGLICPIQFIPLAEETGLINKIGDWIFKESARWAKKFSSQFDSDFQVSVNLSPIQFRTENNIFVEEWLIFLQKLGLSGKNLVIEITEGLLLNAEPEVIDKLLQFRDAGIEVAIDDFGTGYSSLSYIKKFEIDYLKIDRSFTSNLETDKNDIALSEAIIVMAHKLGLKVIAEGVEYVGQQNRLRDSGCDYAQGYLYSKPIPPEEFEKLLQHNLANTG